MPGGSAPPGWAGVYLPIGETTIDLITGDCLLLVLRLERRPARAGARAPPRPSDALPSRARSHPRSHPRAGTPLAGAGVDPCAPQAGRPNDLLAQPSVAERLGGALITGLLLAAGFGHHTGRAEPAGPGPVRRALEMIEDHYPEPLTITDLAAASHISVRRLQAGFGRHVGVPPMTYLCRFRLERAHELLRRAEPETTSVTEVAMTCGLRHLGRFAAEYHGHYGETPSQTLHRRNGRT